MRNIKGSAGDAAVCPALFLFPGKNTRKRVKLRGTVKKESCHAFYVRAFCIWKKVFKTLPEQSKELIRRHKALYLIGLHGPDILFYYKALSSNPVNDLGYRMHGEPAADFLAGL